MAAALAASALLGLRRHPAQVLAALACCALGGAIIGNAVLFQSGRHPAPLFAHPAATPSGERAEVPPVPLPAPRPMVAAPHLRAAEPPPAEQASAKDAAPAKPAPSSTPPVHAVASKASTAHRPDAIGQLLRGTDKPGAEPGADAHVLAAQRALEKLGFAVKPDGRMGAATRAGLEKFQRDRHIEPAGDLSPKLLRELAAAAGLPPG